MLFRGQKLTTMKNLVLTLFSVLMCLLSYSQNIEGLWSTGKENTNITILNEGGELVGKIESSDNRKAPIGEVILKDLVKEGDSWKGKLFVIKKQRWVDVTISPYKSKLELLVSAGFSRKKVEWEKVD